MNKLILTKAIVFASTLYFAGMSLSCDQSKSDKSELIISRLCKNIEITDSLKKIHNENFNINDKNSILVAISDSTDNTKALVLATLFKPQEIADYVLIHPSKELISCIKDNLIRIFGNDALNEFSASLDNKFKAISVARQAKFVTSIATPKECASYLEATDSLLRDEIINIYRKKADYTAITQFKDNINYNF
jgi:hypothetical protein